MGRLEGKVALVTGAARGIGAGIARAFAREGAFVWLTDVDHAAGAALVDSIGARAAYHPLDVRDEARWEQAIEALLAAHGRLDVLVNNAGITGLERGGVPQDPEHASLDDWHAIHRVNLDGTFLGCKHAIRTMRAHGTGSIINMSSRSGLVGIPFAAAYASSKAAIRNHTKSVALYCASQGLSIRCNSIHPAAILTSMWEPMLGDGEVRAGRLRRLAADTPLRRLGTVEEVAAIAVMLASDECTYMTGAELHVDGGILAGSAGMPDGD
jgi:NAD(P)-dependent dehydrogenase (short-subunit alcohol dehydrogenase family)